MEYQEWHDVDKSDWIDGPWKAEPDKVQWKDEQTGLPCLAVRHPSGGHFCGYVGVSPEHPWHGVDYDNCQTADGEWVDVHGGLTFADKCQPDGRVCHVTEGEDDVWWLGFDCAHAGDLSPGHERIYADLNLGSRGESYKGLGYVKHECQRLAQQLAEVA